MAASLQSHLSGIARSGTANLLGAAIAAVLNFGVIIVVTQLFPQQTAGSLFSLTSVFVIALAVCSLGTDVGLSRFLLRYRSLGRQQDMSALVSAARTPVLLCAVLVALVGVACSGQIAGMLGFGGRDAALAVAVLMLLLPFAALGDFSLAAARGLGTFRSTVLSEKLLRPVLQPLGALVVSLAGGGLVWLTASWAVPYVIAAVLALVLMEKAFAAYRTPRSMYAPRLSQVRREFWSFTWPRALARISQAVIQRADIVIVAALLGPSPAAVYTAATRFVALGQFGVNAIVQVLQPRFSQLLAEGERKTLETVFKTTTSWNMAVAWPLYVIAFAGADFYLTVFGEGYATQPARLVVWVMALAMMLATAAGPLDTMLLMSGYSATSLVISLTGLALNIGLCFALIPVLQLPGAALAWAVAIVVRNLLTFLAVRSKLGLVPWGRSAALVGSAAVVCFGLPLLPVVLAGSASFPAFSAAIGVGLVLYVLVLLTLRRPLQLQAFARLLPSTRAREA